MVMVFGMHENYTKVSDRSMACAGQNLITPLVFEAFFIFKLLRFASVHLNLGVFVQGALGAASGIKAQEPAADTFGID